MPGPHQWYISYLVLEALAKITVVEEHHDALNALPRDMIESLCQWLMQQVRTFLGVWGSEARGDDWVGWEVLVFGGLCLGSWGVGWGGEG